MPTYQYACTSTDCRHEFEQFQSFTDAALTDCPVCGQRVRKVYGSVGVVFKGSGFYRNDSRDAKSSSTAAAKDGGKSESGPSKDSSKDTSKSGDAASSGSAAASNSSSAGSSTGSATGSASAPKAAAAS